MTLVIAATDTTVSTGLTPKITINQNAPKINQTNPIKNNQNQTSTQNTTQTNTANTNTNNNPSQTNNNNENNRNIEDYQTQSSQTTSANNAKQITNSNTIQQLTQQTQKTNENNIGITGNAIVDKTNQDSNLKYIFAITFITTLIILLAVFSFLIKKYDNQFKI